MVEKKSFSIYCKQGSMLSKISVFFVIYPQLWLLAQNWRI